MSRTPLLTVGYSALASRSRSMSLPTDQAQVQVLVCVQGGRPAQSLEREPAEVVALAGSGVARSRNAVMDLADGRYLLFCDDDVVVDLEGVMQGVRHLQRTGHAIALGRGIDPSGRPRKRYPRRVRRLTLTNSAKAATYEMLIDLQQVREKGLRFDVRFGAGAPVRLGDEYVFIAEMLRAGLTGEAVPWVFGMHAVTSSGSTWGTERDTHERAVVINRVFGHWALPARIAFALKNRSSLGSLRLVALFVADSTRTPGGRERLAPEHS